MRIIGGSLGGRKIVAPPGLSTRPTSDRTRQALFDVVGPLEASTTVLDLYAGSGALGLEALSRGARSAVFVESDSRALKALSSNVAALGLSGVAEVLRLEVERSRKALVNHGTFDVIFCDPPWREAPWVAKRVLPRLLFGGSGQEEKALLHAGGRLFLEHSAREPITELGEAGLSFVDRRLWGDAAVTLFRRP